MINVVQNRFCPGVTFGLMTILLRFWTNICPCWLDVMFQPRSLMRVVDWCESVGKADLQSDHFDSNPSREAFELPLTCHPSPSLTTFAFMSREVRHLLLDFDSYGGTDPLCMFSLFLKRTADVMAPHLSVVFRRLVRLGSFPPCWRQANDTPIPKDPPSSSVAN